MKPTYEELRQALQALTVDAYETYSALKTGQPAVSVGQWGRLQRAQKFIGAIADAESA